MKAYGAQFATEFTKKQIGVVYAAAKRGDLKVEKWTMSNLYDLADYYGYDSNRSVAYAERKILAILDAVFANDMAKAQELIDEYTEERDHLCGKKVVRNHTLIA